MLSECSYLGVCIITVFLAQHASIDRENPMLFFGGFVPPTHCPIVFLDLFLLPRETYEIVAEIDKTSPRFTPCLVHVISSYWFSLNQSFTSFKYNLIITWFYYNEHKWTSLRFKPKMNATKLSDILFDQHFGNSWYKKTQFLSLF